MLARVPITSAYDPSTERMLAHATPSYKIAVMITGLVIDHLGTNDFLVDKSYLLLLPCNLFIVLFPQSTYSFILVLGKANVKVCVELYQWSIEFEGIFVLPLAPRWVRHSYLSKKATNDPLYLWVIKTFYWRCCKGAIAWSEYFPVCLFVLRSILPSSPWTLDTSPTYL